MHPSQKNLSPLSVECQTVPLPLDQLPNWARNKDANEGDENGPFLVKNETGDVLDRRNYCGWKAPKFGDGYSE